MLLKGCTVKTLHSDVLYNSKILYNFNCFCTNVPISLNWISSQQKFSLTSNYLGTNSVVLKRVDCSHFCRWCVFIGQENINKGCADNAVDVISKASADPLCTNGLCLLVCYNKLGIGPLLAHLNRRLMAELIIYQ